jgi:hypothetical protein
MTDKVIANIKEKYDDIDDLDGLDELKYFSLPLCSTNAGTKI